MSTEIVKTGGALAIRPDQTDWTQEQQLVLRQSGIDDDVTKAELSGFLHLCQKTGLDPFSRQIYLIGRWDKQAGRKVFTPQTGIDGYRVVANRVVEKAAVTLGYEDTFWCGKDGVWRDVWVSDEPPAAAKVIVLRNGQRFPAVAGYREYVQTNRNGEPTGMWRKMPAGQLAKCAEALALRKAFPNDLAGVYTAEEMAQADNPAADERHLRSVQPNETDPWATPGPDAGQQQTVATKGRSQPAQDFADAAAKATDQAAMKGIYRQANTAGLLGEMVKTADRELLELGAYLIARGQELASAPTTSGEATDPAPRVVSGQVMSAQEQAEAAERELRQFAEQVGLPDIAADFEGAKGVPLEAATADQIRGFLNELRGTAA